MSQGVGQEVEVAAAGRALAGGKGRVSADRNHERGETRGGAFYPNPSTDSPHRR